MDYKRKDGRIECWELQPLELGEWGITNKGDEEENASEVWEIMVLHKASEEGVSGESDELYQVL